MVGTMRNNEHEEEQPWTASKLTSASYKDLGLPEHVSDRFLSFLLSSERCLSLILNVVRSGPSKSLSTHFSIEINVFELMQHDNVMATMLLRYPFALLGLLEEAIVRAQRIVIEQYALVASNLPIATVKGDQNTPTKIHARLVHLPPHINCCKPSLSCIDAGDVGNIVQISGTVVRASPVRMIEKSRSYVCKAKNCGHRFIVYADFEQSNNALNVPTICSNLETSNGKPCKGNVFEILPGESEHTDYQEIKIQESATKMGHGTIPRSILVKMEHDLVDCCKPGDDVVIVGTLSTQWQPTSANIMCDISIALHAHSVRVVNSEEHSTWEESQSGNTRDKLRREFDEFWNRPLSKARPLYARNYIVKSVCPKLYGLSTIKLALLLTLIGGISGLHLEPQENISEDEEKNRAVLSDQFVLRAEQCESSSLQPEDDPLPKSQSGVEPARAKRREQCHLLLVGDPGCGKSVFLRWASTLSPRSVLTTGCGTTSAGLTCAAVRDGGKDFVLEAGALVLADRGVCCIDEFGCIRNDDRTTIHEAMEQQTLSVAKGGIVCKLSCRTTIIAACNPIGGLYEMCDSLSKNTGIGMPLLSRFDLIFKLVDLSDIDRDSKIAAHLLNSAIQGSGFLRTADSQRQGDEEVWNMEKLRAYIATVKSRFKPRISPSAAQLLQAHYQSCRMSENPTVQVTVRLFEALIRLSQAHARLMFRNTVTLQDAVCVILLMECSVWSVGGSNATFADTFPLNHDPMEDFRDDSECDSEFLREQYALLARYGLLDLLPESERKQVETASHSPII
mmetsp:Transcript_15773/g.22529  ORF Transcript_15773/g.22529 Transcript_15773/m.22529 type:complete len:791 (-) Transcript_15773:2048-4420(-)